MLITQKVLTEQDLSFWLKAKEYFGFTPNTRMVILPLLYDNSHLYGLRSTKLAMNILAGDDDHYDGAYQLNIEHFRKICNTIGQCCKLDFYKYCLDFPKDDSRLLMSEWLTDNTAYVGGVAAYYAVQDSLIRTSSFHRPMRNFMCVEEVSKLYIYQGQPTFFLQIGVRRQASDFGRYYQDLGINLFFDYSNLKIRQYESRLVR